MNNWATALDLGFLSWNITKFKYRVIRFKRNSHHIYKLKSLDTWIKSVLGKVLFVKSQKLSYPTKKKSNVLNVYMLFNIFKGIFKTSL